MEKETHRGKQYDQKLKPLLVYLYLCKYSDENNAVAASAIVDYLTDSGIKAERRSIYTDIQQINKILLMNDEDCSIEEAETMIADDPDSNQTIIYDKSQKGFYVKHRLYELDTVRLLAESIYAARFVDKIQMEQLIDIVCGLVSDNQAEKIRHDVINSDHFRTKNSNTFFNVSLINEAMAPKIGGQPHTAEKIGFKYVQYSISDMKQSIQKRKGEDYIVSPYQLIINDGNYYLSGYDDKYHKMMTYRVDRMKNVKLLGVPRDGADAAAKVDYKTYTQRVFSMFGGEKEKVILHFSSHLLDTVVEKFGDEKIKYHQIDDKHFSIIADVEISPQFFGWLCGFGSEVQIIEPGEIREKYKKYLTSIISKYE